MHSRWILFIVFAVSLSLQGCETVKGTAKGFSKDVQTSMDYMYNEDNWLQKTDNWIQEHLW